jgi:GTP-binding protein
MSDEELEVAKANLLRDELKSYELEEDDIEILETDLDEYGSETYLPAPPVLAVVGRPNVGKSALVNRILGRREAVVEDKPGITRDRVTYRAEWNGRQISLVDTGGWEIDAEGIHLSVAEQAEVAVELADAVLFVVDAMVGPTASDEQVVKMLRSSGKPVLLVANKIDDSHSGTRGCIALVSWTW